MPRSLTPQYVAPQPTDPYYGDYSALAQQLAGIRNKPVFSIGQGVADALGDIGTAYFDKKARDKAKGEQTKDFTDYMLASQLAGDPSMTANRAAVQPGSQTPGAQPTFSQEQVSAPGAAPVSLTHVDPNTGPMSAQQRYQAALQSLAGVNPRAAQQYAPQIAQDAVSAQPQAPIPLPAVKPGEVVPVRNPVTGQLTTGFTAPPEKPKLPEQSPLSRLISERDVLPPADPRRATLQAAIDKETRAAPDPTEMKTPQRENMLRDEFTQITKPYVAVRDANEKVKAGVKAQTAAGDMAAIYAYMKILDPTSTVREGEYASAEQARGVPDTILNLYNKVASGQKLTVDQRKDFSERANDIVQSQKPLFVSTKERYTDLAKRNGLDPKNVVFDFDIPAEGAQKEPSKMTDDEIRAALKARNAGGAF